VYHVSKKMCVPGCVHTPLALALLLLFACSCPAAADLFISRMYDLFMSRMYDVFTSRM